MLFFDQFKKGENVLNLGYLVQPSPKNLWSGANDKASNKNLLDLITRPNCGLQHHRFINA